MPSQDDFPEKWACESPNKKVRVEVRVPNTAEEVARLKRRGATVEESEYSWIEIPTSEVEQYTTKGGAARIQRSAKVTFPSEWGRAEDARLHASPRKLVEQLSANQSESFMWARISFRRERGDEDSPWVYTHFGWLGGVGAASEEATSKFWVYDPAELMSGAQVGVSFNHPTVKQAMEKVAFLVNNETPIPLSEVEIVPPETDEEFAIFADTIEEGGISGSGTLDDAGVGDVASTPESTIYYYKDGTEWRSTPVEDGENFSAAIVASDDDIPPNAGRKTFKTNRHSLQDVFDWLESKTGAKMHFQPQPDGRSVRLILDVTPERRVFAQDSVVEEGNAVADILISKTDAERYSFHQNVTVLDNNALYEMKPVNTVHVDGATGSGYLDAAADWIQNPGDAVDAGVDVLAGTSAPSKKYPYAKVRAPALYQAADGVELGPHIDADADTEAGVVEVAKTKLSKLLEEVTEGDITLKGEPQLMPFDAIDSYEVCRGEVIFEPQPVRYEVEEVKHTASADDIFRSRALVSVWANSETIEVVESGMAEQSTSIED